MSDQIICVPKEDQKTRILLGRAGQNTLLAIALNPSTANSQVLDPTSQNIKKIAKQMGCDGWMIMNLCSLRTANPKELPNKISLNRMNTNLSCIEKMVLTEMPAKILLCWGNGIYTRDYLLKASTFVLQLLAQKQVEAFCLGHTNLNQPYHPSPQVINRIFGGVDNVRLKKFKGLEIKRE